MIPSPVRPEQQSHQTHWDSVYATRDATQVSWYQEDPHVSLALIRKLAPPPDSRIVDIGGGASVLVDRLLDAGYRRPIILDISSQALAQARSRLGARAEEVDWLVGDITEIERLPKVDLWHDRAVFHFLTQEEDRQKYVSLAERTLPNGAQLIVATFAPDGPDHCSGLEVRRYDAQALTAAIGPKFALRGCTEEIHWTPWGAPQPFIYGLFERL